MEALYLVETPKLAKLPVLAGTLALVGLPVRTVALAPLAPTMAKVCVVSSLGILFPFIHCVGDPDSSVGRAFGTPIAQSVERRPNNANYTFILFLFPNPLSSTWVVGSLGIWRKVSCDRLTSCPRSSNQLLLVRLTLQKPG